MTRFKISASFGYHIGGLGLALCSIGAFALAQPTVTTIGPRTDFTTNQVIVTLTGTGLNGANPTLVFQPSSMVEPGSTLSNINDTGTSATATFTLTDAATGIIDVSVQAGGVTSKSVPFDTQISTECLEAFKNGDCQLRLTVTGTSATGSSSQTKNSTTPNILASIDYQFFAPKDPPTVARAALRKATLRASAAASERAKAAADQNHTIVGTAAKARFDAAADKKTAVDTEVTAAQTKLANANANPKQGMWDRATGHLVLTSGYTQIVTAKKLEPAPAPAAATPAATTMTTTATPQQAFIADAKLNFGWTFGRDGHSYTFSEAGVSFRGSFQDLISTNQVVQSGGLTYIDLSANNSKNAVGFYEVTGHYKLAALGHNRAASTASGHYHNVSNFAVLEAGYQNNSGLRQLIATNPQANTRNRFVGRFYLYPPLPSAAKQTTLTMGMEYNGGLDGGPKIIQIFFGTNLNPGKLFSSNSGQ